MDETDFNLSGKGPNVSIDRTYNSQDTGTGLFGKGWHSSLEEVMKEESSEIFYIQRETNPHYYLLKQVIINIKHLMVFI